MDAGCRGLVLGSALGVMWLIRSTGRPGLGGTLLVLLSELSPGSRVRKPGYAVQGVLGSWEEGI